MSVRDRRMAHIAFDAGWDAHEAFARPEIREALQVAYNAGWSNACADWMRQDQDPTYPIGRGRNSNYSPEPTDEEGDAA